MRVVINSFGSTGDFEPFLALAQELTKHGHDALLALPPQFCQRAEAVGVKFAPVGPTAVLGGIRNMVMDEITHQGTATHGIDSYFPTSDMLTIFSDLQKICAGADALICSAEWPLGRIIHELTHIPYVSVHLTYFNEQYARAGLKAIDFVEAQFSSYINPFRQELGLSPLYNLISTDGISEQLALFAISRLLLDSSQEEYWPDHYHVTGFCFLNEQTDWHPDAQLLDFLSAGPKPIIFTFGSMVYENSQDILDILSATILELGCRAIFITGWNEISSFPNLSDNIHIAKFIPYHWLFSQASCIVQSGGAGTISWALRSGVPVVCVPHVYEQFSFARFVELSKCGKSLPFRELSVDKLVATINEVLSSPKYGEAAKAASRTIKTEAGVVTARRHIEQWYDNLQNK